MIIENINFIDKTPIHMFVLKDETCIVCGDFDLSYQNQLEY